MSWPRALAAWLLIVAAETVHGVLRSIFLVPRIGDLASRQWGVLPGSLIILLLAVLTIRWIGARTAREQFAVGAAWTVLMVAFELGLGTAMGLGRERLLSDYDPARGGFMLFGLAVLMLSPWIAARVRRPRSH